MRLEPYEDDRELSLEVPKKNMTKNGPIIQREPIETIWQQPALLTLFLIKIKQLNIVEKMDFSGFLNTRIILNF